ncbi:helix-turn-helix domain-containing protein [Streptomyces sp. NBC_00826]|uniref:AraC-like ligand-binding domain-containing protein n=1 Tax=Streptomyces sp. NBC_00826 TaxID=2975845 RepID=UPI002F918BB9|nr:helix-turn-helix domain-containing protein [Streptomyces sp. NBC_00826]
MIEDVFSTDGLPKADRWASWYEFGTQSHLPTLIRTDHQDDFQGAVRVLDLGPVQVSTLTYSPLNVLRTPKLIRQSDPGVLYFVVHQHGRIGVAQNGREAVLASQGQVIYDTSRPFTAWATAEHGAVAGCVILQVPRELLPIRSQTLNPLIAVGLPQRGGLGALLSRHLAELTRNAPHCTAADAARLATITADLFAALCAHELETVDALPPETHRRALQTQIHEFIRQRLGDPALSPGTIAAAHRISTRQLYKIFQDQGLTVADWIRRCRLERCRHDLADPQLHPRPVHAIAARWGFTSAANFSRTFRAAYGLPPGEYRKLHHIDAGEKGQASCTP